MNTKQYDENPARFALTEETLTDGSMVYGVRFSCDYDPYLVVALDCEDKEHAEEILAALEAGVCNVEVQDTDKTQNEVA